MNARLDDLLVAARAADERATTAMNVSAAYYRDLEAYAGEAFWALSLFLLWGAMPEVGEVWRDNRDERVATVVLVEPTARDGHPNGAIVGLVSGRRKREDLVGRVVRDVDRWHTSAFYDVWSPVR